MKNSAEQATGCVENPHGLGKFYDDKGNELTAEQAVDHIRNGSVEVPNAGAGSYDKVFRLLGFQECKVIEWGSSAGDWTFGVKDDDTWLVAFQTNRYPYHGFRYSVDFTQAAETFEELCNYAG